MVCVAVDCKLEVVLVIRVSVEDYIQIGGPLQVLEDPEEEVVALSIPRVVPPGDLRDCCTKIRARATADPEQASAMFLGR